MHLTWSHHLRILRFGRPWPCSSSRRLLWHLFLCFSFCYLTSQSIAVGISSLPSRLTAIDKLRLLNFWTRRLTSHGPARLAAIDETRSKGTTPVQIWTDNDCEPPWQSIASTTDRKLSWLNKSLQKDYYYFFNYIPHPHSHHVSPVTTRNSDQIVLVCVPCSSCQSHQLS